MCVKGSVLEGCNFPGQEAGSSRAPAGLGASLMGLCVRVEHIHTPMHARTHTHSGIGSVEAGLGPCGVCVAPLDVLCGEPWKVQDGGLAQLYPRSPGACLAQRHLTDTHRIR